MLVKTNNFTIYMSEIPIAIKIEPMDILRTCRRCGFLFNIDNPYNANPYNANPYNANQYRCKKCLSTKPL